MNILFIINTMSEYIALMDMVEAKTAVLIIVGGMRWEITKSRVVIKVGDYLLQIERRGYGYVDINTIMLRAPGYPPDMDKLIATIPRVILALSEQFMVPKDSLVQTALNYR